MDKQTTSMRLKTIMENQNLKQVDILNRCKPFCEKYNVKMNKSDISQYLSGKIEPTQNKLAILAMALDVNETWLMGFDVPTMRVEYESSTKNNQPFNRRILKYYNEISKIFDKLNKDNQQKVISFSNKLLELQNIEEETLLNAAHADNYESSSDELKLQEENIMDDENF